MAFGISYLRASAKEAIDGVHKMTTLIIPRRFNGPPQSGNGGYSCGVLAAELQGVDCKVRLHKPPPLDTPLIVTKISSEQVEMLHGDITIGTVWATELVLDIPQAPTLAQARRASEGYLCYEGHSYPSCFVCGPGRPDNDGLCLFPGPVDDWRLLACTWRPSSDLLDELGMIRPEIIWSALDCPGFYAAAGEALVPVLLGELTAQLRAPIPGDQELVVYCWPLGKEGRKLFGGVAIANQQGNVLASASSVWIELAGK